jgi:large subunit ribosomal protein L19e
MILQKRLAARILKCSPHRIRFDNEQMEEIKGSITKADVRRLVIGKAIYVLPKGSGSRARARKRHLQRKKGRQRGFGTRKGKKTARLPGKESWIHKIRVQKALLLKLRESKKIDRQMFFRNVRHIKVYMSEQMK